MSLNVRQFRPLFAALLLAVSTLWAGTVFATTMKYLDVASLIQDSDVIVRGRVVAQTYKFDDTRGNVMTHYTFRVNRTFLGETSKTLEFVQWGGEWNGMVSGIPGDATFGPKEDVVLFLNEHKGTLYLTALGQSKYTVKQTKGGPIIERDLSDVGLFQEGEAKLPRINLGGVERVSYASFVAELQTLVAAIKGGSK